nr:MAG TPA: zinc-ribbon containing domain protein [Caudoviricetes sp.]
MGDLISREVALIAIDAHERMARRNGIKDSEIRPTLDAVRRIIQALPDVNAETIRWGMWIDLRETSKDVPQCKCSECGYKRIGLETNYCSNCGAKMDGGR